ncbi:hypothetical protein C0J52_14021 [Blattella germanica]|nr:hypothetical protein C0J52_14021 [Blattella germanica]
MTESESEIKPWKEKVLEEQQLYYEMLGDRDWDCYRETEIEFLERNVGHAMFGPPEELPEDKNGNTGYNEKKLEQIRKVCSAIKEHNKYPSINGEHDTWLSVIFVCLNMKEQSVPVPVFRIPNYNPETTKKGTSGCLFVDSNCRIYKDWTDFLTNNKLPKCDYCYPVNGIYYGDADDKVVVEIGRTPACKITNQICNVLDTASTVVMVGGMAVTVAGLFATIAAPVAVVTSVGAVTTGIYGIGRSAATLVDRGKHKQSLGIKEAESRDAWISVVGNTVGMASTQAIQMVTKMTREGEVLCNSLTVNGLGLLNNILRLREKAVTGDLRPLDVFQFTSSLLFFTMSAINMKTANAIIRETQDGMLGSYETSLRSNRHRREFRRLVKETQGVDGNSIQGNARVIKGINQITHKDDFFAGLVRVRQQFSQSDAKVVLTDTGLVEINGQLHLHPMRFWEIDKMQRQLILDATKNLNQGVWSQKQFNEEMKLVCDQHQIVFKSQRNETLSSLNKVMAKAEKKPSGAAKENCISQLNGNQVDMISYQLHRFAKQHHKKLINIAVNLADLMGYRKTAEFLRIVGFVANYVEEVVVSVELKYQEDLCSALNAQGDDFDREVFDREYNIQGTRRDHFIRTVLTNYNTYEALVHLKRKFEKLVTLTVNDSEPSLGFETDQANAEAIALTESVKRFGKKYHRQIIGIAVNLADLLGFRSNPELIALTDFVANYFETILSQLEINYENALKTALESGDENFSLEEFDKKYNIEGNREEHFIMNILHTYEDYEQLKQLKSACEANIKQNENYSEAGPSGIANNASVMEISSSENESYPQSNHSNKSDETSTTSKDSFNDDPICSLYMQERNFEKEGGLSNEEIYDIARELTGLYLFEGNTLISRDSSMSFVTINDPHIEPVTVLITTNAQSNTVNATIIM